MITPADIRARFEGAFDVKSDDLLLACIEEAAFEIDEGVWGDAYDLGLKYAAAHLAATTPAPGGGASGTLTSKRVGDVSWSFAAPAAAFSESGWGSTSYGRRFLELRSIYQGGPVTACLTGEVTVEG